MTADALPTISGPFPERRGRADACDLTTRGAALARQIASDREVASTHPIEESRRPRLPFGTRRTRPRRKRRSASEPIVTPEKLSRRYAADGCTACRACGTVGQPQEMRSPALPRIVTRVTAPDCTRRREPSADGESGECNRCDSRRGMLDDLWAQLDRR